MRSPSWSPGVLAEDWTHGGFGLYVHWPFCQSKCPYCDFNSHVVNTVDHDAWTSAFVTEIARLRADIGPRRLETVFFGGGTPSLMPPDTVAAVIDAAFDAWPGTNDREVTLEANPTSVEAQSFAAYRAAGVTRISMGIQALNDADLRRLGRMHSVTEAMTALDIARSTFQRVSFDLIAARQYQTVDAWRAELHRAVSTGVDHLSIYQLTIEDGTRFGDLHQKGRLRGLPDDDLSADIYDITQELCEAHGLPAYEVSNHARPGAESRHNLIYWRYGDYAGIGPGAHGRLTLDGQKHATEAIRLPADWLNAVQSGVQPDVRTVLTGQAQAEEYAMMGLRISEGIDMSRFFNLSGTALPEDAVQDLKDLGLLDQRGTHLRVTPRGRPVLNAILGKLLT